MPFDKAQAELIATARKVEVLAPAIERMASRSTANKVLVVINPPAPSNNESHRAHVLEMSSAVVLATRLQAQGRQVIFYTAGLRGDSFGEAGLSLPLLDAANVQWGIENTTNFAIINTSSPAARVSSTAEIATAVRNLFDDDDQISSVYVMGPQHESLRVLTEYENAGLVVEYVTSDFDLRRAETKPFHGESIYAIPAALNNGHVANELLSPETDELMRSHSARYNQGIKFWQDRRTSGAQEVLIAITSQHPLKNGVEPGEEYEARIRGALSLAASLPAGTPVRFLTVGQVHDDPRDASFKPDYVSLGLAGKTKLLQLAQEVQFDLLPSQITVIDRGVGNGDHEVKAAADYVKAHSEVARLITVASHAQIGKKGITHQIEGVPSEFVSALLPFSPIHAFHKAAWEAAFGVAFATATLVQPELQTISAAHAARREARGGLYADKIATPEQDDTSAFMATVDSAVNALLRELAPVIE